MGILDLVFPKTCLECKKEGEYICSLCLEKVRLLPTACPYCERSSIRGLTHKNCREKYGLDRLTSIWKYEGVIKKAILALKFKHATEVENELSEIFLSQLGNMKLLPYKALVPIPVHWYRENIRGFNQSELIGKKIAEKMDLRFMPHLLTKKRATTSQVELRVQERKQNLKGVFELSRGKISDSVILFDDVFTTGSTLKEATQVLKKGGVKKVWGLTLAR